MYHRSIALLILCAMLCCLMAGCAANDVPDTVPEQAAQPQADFQREADLDNAPAIGIPRDQLMETEDLLTRYQAEGWEVAESTLCVHGGAVIYNDLTLQRMADGTVETRHFCAWQNCDFEP